MANTWTDGVNDDGLRVLFDNEEAAVGKGGMLNMLGPHKVAEWKVAYTDFVTAGSTDTSSLVLDYDTYIPDNARIEKVELVAETLWDSSGNGFKFNIGLVKATDFSTVIDYDGLVNSLAETTMDAAGNVVEIVPEGTGAGALIGTTITDPGVLSIYWETEAPTAGVAKVRVFYTVAW